MLHHVRRTQILPLLAVIGVAMAQICGLARGYLCDCSGVPVLTAVDHCHDEHDAACAGERHHHDRDDPLHHAGHHDASGCGNDATPHAIAKDSLQANPSTAKMALPSDAMLLVSVLPAIEFSAFSTRSAEPRSDAARRRPPPLSCHDIRSVVMLL